MGAAGTGAGAGAGALMPTPMDGAREAAPGGGGSGDGVAATGAIDAGGDGEESGCVFMCGGERKERIRFRTRRSDS